VRPGKHRLNTTGLSQYVAVSPNSVRGRGVGEHTEREVDAVGCI